MKANGCAIALLSVIMVCLLAAPAMAGDHGGADWTPANGAEITGVHYNIGTFTVTNGWTVNVAEWDSGADGFVQIYADTIDIAGTLNGAVKGYPGGAGAGDYYNPPGSGNPWYPGRGTGDGGTHNEVDGAGQYSTLNHRLSSGGGGGYGGEGGLGCGYWTRYSGVGDAPGGDAFGTPDTYQLKIGASGAGGGGGLNDNTWGGDGGDGGAGILLSAETITITGAITVDGEDGEDGEDGYKGGGGGGGGAGGCILMYAGTLSGDGSLYADAGDGGDSGDGSPSSGHAAGGAGGGAGGRIKIWYNTSTFTGSHSVMNGSGGAHGEADFGHGLDGYPGEEGTYQYSQYDEDCLGTCYDGTVCEGVVITENVTCWACLVEAGRSWSNYEFDSPCAPGTMVPRRCYDYCPECCDGINNSDGDAYIDWPNDPECKCCLDETEEFKEGCPVECVPELATLTLMGCGLGALFGLVKFKNRRKR